jgi:spermidine synthase
VTGRNSTLAIEHDNATGGVSYWEGGDNQSVADRNGVSLAEYIHAMFGLLRQAKARDVLMIGCGGGTLATMLHRAGVKVTIVDISAASFDIARRYFHLPDEVERHVVDGRSYLRRSRALYDAIVLDAYSGSTMPRQFLTKSFFDLAKNQMKPRSAIFLANLLVADDDDRSPDRIVRRMRQTWRQARLLDADGWDNRNAIAVAGAVGKLTRPKLLMPPARGSAKIARGMKEFSFRRLRA